MKPEALRVLLIGTDADDAKRVRKILRGDPTIEVESRVVRRGDDVADGVSGDGWDVVLVDLSSSSGDATALLRRMRQRIPATPIVVLADIDEKDSIHAAIQAGAQDCVAKEHLTVELLAATMDAAIERARARQAIEEERRRLFQTLDALPMFVYLQAPDYSIPFANRTFHELFGETEGRPCYEVFHGYAEPCADCPPMRVQKTGRPEVSEWTSAAGRTYAIYDQIFSGLGETPLTLEVGLDITEQRRAQEDLANSEARFRRLAENAPDIIYRYRVSPTPRFEYISPAVTEVSGYTPEEYYADPLLVVKVAHPDDRHLAENLVRGRVQARRTQDVRWIHKDGEIRWTEDHYVPVYDASGNLVAIEGVARDITDWKRAQLALAESEERYRLLFEHAGIGIGYYTPDGVLIGYNRVAAGYMGGLPEDFAGKTIPELFGAEKGPEYLRRVVDASKREQTVTYEDLVELPGGPTWFLSTYSRVETSDGEVVGVQILSKDITARKASEAALRESERRFRELSELLPEVIYECDAQGRITFANRVAFERFGYTKDDLERGIDALEMLVPEDRERASADTGRILEGETLGGTEYTALAHDGSTFPVIVHSSVVSRGDEVVGLRGLLVDISEERRAREALETADAIVSALPTGMLIYEFREPDELLLVSGNSAAAPFVDVRGNAGLAMESHWPQTMIEKLRPSLLSVVRDGGVHDREVTVGPTGAEHAFHMRAFRIPGDRVVIAFEDVTDRKRAEEALRAEEEKYRLLFENMMNGFALHEVVRDEAGRPVDYVFLEANAAFERLLGKRREELIGRRVTEAVPGIEKDSADWIGTYGAIAVSGGEARFEQYSDSLGRWFSVLAFGSGPDRFATIFEDVTERKRAEAAAAEWRTRYEGAVRASRHILYDWDPTTDEVTYGGDLQRILGYAEDEMTGGLAQWTDLVHPDDRPGFQAAIDRLIENRDAAHLRYRIRKKDGEYLHIEDDGSFILDADGRPIRMLGFVKDVTERQRAAERIEESEWRYRSIVELSPVGIVTVSLKGIVTSCNRAYLEMTGYDSDELLGKHFSKLPAARLRDAPKYVRMFGSILNGTSPKPFETQWQRKDGTDRVGEVRVALMKQAGKVWGVQVIVHDITERKVAESELRESELRYRSLVQNAVLGIYRTTPDGRILAANPALVRMLGYESFAELARRNLEAEGYEPGTPRAAFKQAIEASGSLVGREAAWTRKDGSTLFVRENSRVVRDEAGKVLYYEGTIEDITERMEAEREAEALRVQLELTQHSVDSTEAVVLWVLPSGEVTYANETACRMLEYSREELLSLAVWDIDTNSSRESRPSAWDELKRAGGEASESAFRTKGGRTFPVQVTAQYLEFRGRELEFAVAFDISEQKRLEARLSQSQRLESIGTLASGVAHEINNPLTGIINYAQLISDRIEDPTLKEFAEGIKEEGDRVAKIVRNLLSFSRREKEHHSPARIVDIVDASLSLYAALLRRDGIELEVDVPEDLPYIRCRSQEIQQVVINLLTNARDSLNLRYPDRHDEKRIAIRAHVAAEGESEWLRLSVEDHGQGIPEELLDRVFDPFFTTKPRDRGTGLGLSISYGLVRDHGGRMVVESVYGEGSRFLVDLPLNNEPAKAG